MPVLAREPDTHTRAVGHLHEARALQMEKEGIHRIIDPEQFQAAPRERAGVDLPSARQRQPAAVGLLQPARGPRRRAINRHVESRGTAPGPSQHRFVVTGEKTPVRDAVEGPVRDEIFLKERPCGAIAGADEICCAADLPPVRDAAEQLASAERLVGPPGSQCRAGLPQRQQRRGMLICLPVGQVAEPGQNKRRRSGWCCNRRCGTDRLTWGL
jgi:hypothetical protein